MFYETISPPNISYRTYKISKGNGKYRVITAPNDSLKKYQRHIMDYLESFSVHNSAHGFIKGRSIASNAYPHINKSFVLNIDLKDFFPSISRKMVEDLFCSIGVIKELAKFATYRGSLPQGSPCSPIISNLFCYDLDIILNELAEQYNYSYSRYADDLTFSGQTYHNNFINKVYTEVIKFGLKVNYSKTKIKWQSQRQCVTGVVVNKKLNVPIETRKKIRAMKHQWDSLTELERQYLAGMNGLDTVLRSIEKSI